MVQYSRSCLPLAVGFAQLWTQSRIQPSWPTTNPPPFWSSQVPWAHAVGGHASKDKQCENSKSILVKMTLKKGTMRGKVLNMWCPIWVCWVNISLIPKQNTGESTQTRKKTLLMRACKVSFLPIVLLWWNPQGPFRSWQGLFPLQLQILPKLPNLFLFQENLLVSHFNFFLINGLPLRLSLPQEQYRENRWLCTPLKIPTSDTVCADTIQWW